PLTHPPPLPDALPICTSLDPRIGFDISGATNQNDFASILTGGTDKLYSINLNTGQATLVGTIGTGTTVYNGLTNATAVPEMSKPDRKSTRLNSSHLGI